MAGSKTPTGESEPASETGKTAEDHDSPFAKLNARQTRRSSAKKRPTASPAPAEHQADVATAALDDLLTPPEPTVTASAPPEANPGPTVKLDLPPARPVASPPPPGWQPRTYQLRDPHANQFLTVFNRIYEADSTTKAVAIIDQVQATYPEEVGNAQARSMWRVIGGLRNSILAGADMPTIRAYIDESLATPDRQARERATETAAEAPPARTRRRRPAARTAVGPSELDGIPAEYDDGVQWLRAGFRRQPWGVLVGLITGWTAIWVALWGAAIGFVIGALAAAGQLTSLGASIGVGQATSALGFVGGGFLGLIGGFALVARFLIIDHPIQTVISVVSGAVLAVLIVVAAAAFERQSIRLRGYRRLSRAEARRVAPLVKSAADAMGLPLALPRFAMADMYVNNAWAHMRTIVITTGMLSSMTDDEIRAVLAHELAHWASGDVVGLQFVWAAAWPVALIYNLGTFMAGRTSPSGIQRSSKRGFLAFAGGLIAWPAWVIIKFFITPVISGTQRAYEYQADAASARAGYATALSSALRKMSAQEGGRTGWEQAMAAVHPPTELRLEALEPPRPDDWDYQEEELRGPSRKELGRLLRFWKPTQP
jgi:Zn-dependent protease with chaperone function